MLEPGTQLGKYQLGRKLGQGGFGIVFRAHDASLDREVALKFLHAEHTATPQILQRFLQEARSAAKIMHPGIVTVFECGQMVEANGAAYIAMELLVGESLTDRLARSGRFMPAAAMEVGRQIAAALEAAHRVGIVHRDLKPDNIFLVSDPAVRGGERIKVLDFGIAKLQRQTSTSMATQSMMVFGTPRYMSPEQCKSAANVDHRSDIYTLGAILFELVTGQPPFAGEPGELIAQHLLVPPPTVSSIVHDIPPELDRLIGALLAKSPDARPQTMARVQLALEGDTSEISGGVAVTMAADAPSLPVIAPQSGRHALGIRPKTNDPFRGNYDATALPSVRPVSNPNPTTLSHATGSSGPALPVARKSRAALYAACGVLAIAAIAGGVMLRGGDHPAAQVAETKLPAPTAAALPPVVAPAPTPAPAPAPAVAPAPVPAPPTPAPIAKTIPKAPVYAARAPAGIGSIAVSSRPACDIFVDGAPIGMHTPQRELKLAAGRHKITLVDTDAKIKDSFFVEIKPGSTQQIDKDYLPKPIAPPVEVHPPVAPPPPPNKDGTINPFATKTP